MGGGRERQRRRDYRRGFETYIHAYMLPCPRRRGVFPGGFLADAAMQCSVDHHLGARAGAGKNKSLFVSMGRGTDQQGSVGKKEERCPAGSPPCSAFFSLFFFPAHYALFCSGFRRRLLWEVGNECMRRTTTHEQTRCAPQARSSKCHAPARCCGVSEPGLYSYNRQATCRERETRRTGSDRRLAGAAGMGAAAS